MLATPSTTDATGWLSAFSAALATKAAALPPVPVIKIAPVLQPVPPAADGGLLTARLLLRVGVVHPDQWVPLLCTACSANEITTKLRVSASLANVVHETGGLTVLREGLNYSSGALLAQWPSHFTPATASKLGRTAQHPADQRGIAEAAYGGREGNGPPGSGDGWLFRGAGGMMTTFRGNVVALARAIGWTRPVEELPDYLATPQGAADSAGAFWRQAKCNAAADRDDITTVRRIVNGGAIGLPQVKATYNAAKVALSA